jgi:hypothetical protein
MKTLWRFGASTALTLIISVACFGLKRERTAYHFHRCGPTDASWKAVSDIFDFTGPARPVKK